MRAEEPASPGADVSVTLAPVVVNASFEMTRPSTAIDSAIRSTWREMDEKRKRDDELARSPVWNARFWSYVPFRLGLSDPKEFFIPSYSTASYRAIDAELRLSEKRALFEH